MSAQILDIQGVADKNEKTPVSAIPSNSQEDEMYTELNACPNVNLYNTTLYKNGASEEKASGRNFTGHKKRLMCVFFIVIMIIVVSTAFSCIIVTFIKISEVNSEVTSLQKGLSSIMAETVMQVFTINSFNRTHVDIWQTISMLSPDAFGSFNNPADSCSAVLALVPSSPSGYYWIRSYNGSVLHVFCDWSCGGVTGGWMRVAELDMTNSSSQCPSGLIERTNSNLRTCGMASGVASCSSVTLPTEVTYSRVCGRIQAYQNGETDAFSYSRLSDRDINTYYVDGVSLTRGKPRQHIWTFAAGRDEIGSIPSQNCQCINVNQDRNSVSHPPAFVGDDYFCDTGSQSRVQPATLYNQNPLWDGAGCGPSNECCSLNNPPWFYKQLPALNIDDIEMRVCSNGVTNYIGVIAIESYDIYIQ